MLPREIWLTDMRFGVQQQETTEPEQKWSQEAMETPTIMSSTHLQS